MEHATELLNEILARSDPHETIQLPLHQAMIIARLDERELGSLSRAIRTMGAVRALEAKGLFSRNVVISSSDAAEFSVVSAAGSVKRKRG